MVAQVHVEGCEASMRSVDKGNVIAMLRGGHTVEEVAFAFDLKRRDVRRIAKRAGILA